MQIKELLTAAGYGANGFSGDVEVLGLASDSRRVKKGDLFVAIKGLNDDGYTHIGEALSRGAVFVVAEGRMTALRNS